MSNFSSIELSTLVTVTGGADGADIYSNGAGPNRTEITGELHGKTPVVDFGGNGTYRSTQTDYAKCLDRLPANTPAADIAKICPLPSAK